MAQKNNATCAICGKGYYACLSCKSFMSLNPWKIHTDTPEHYKIYQIIHGYSTGVYDINEAKNKLQNVDLSDLEDLREHIKALIKEILNTSNEVNENEVNENKIQMKSTSRSRKSKNVVEKN